MFVPTYILHYMMIIILVLSTARTSYHVFSLWKDSQSMHRFDNVFLDLCLKIMLCGGQLKNRNNVKVK